ncbi:MAG: metalloregulator ArsR/SmtB family transcription factor [Planctomycetota bacterium]
MGASLEKSVAAACRAVADPVRVRILATILEAGELCVCHVEAAVGVSQSRASRHLATLKRAGMVVDRREGAWVHYRVPRRPDAIARAILRLIRDTMETDAQTRAIARRAVALRDRTACQGGRR